MKTIILAVAEQELSEAMVYYNSECPGLGYELALEAKESLNRINSFPILKTGLKDLRNI